MDAAVISRPPLNREDERMDEHDDRPKEGRSRFLTEEELRARFIKEPPERAADASKLSFPIQLVISTVVMVVTVAGSYWTLKSDFRNIETKIDAAAQISTLQAQLMEERMANLRDEQAETKKRMELMQLQVQQLRESMIESRLRR